MLVWLVKIGEPLPIDGRRERPLRTGLLARALLSRGHHVVWWTSTFDHANRCYHRRTDERIEVDHGFTLRLLHGPAYKRSTSVRRQLHHLRLTQKFKVQADQENVPDVIVASLPVPELSAACVEFGRRHGIPTAVDVRDLWPDFLIESVPRGLRRLSKLFLCRMNKSTTLACRNASALFAPTPYYLEWALKRAGRKRHWADGDFPVGYPDLKLDNESIREAESFWGERFGISGSDDQFIVCFIGTIGRQSHLGTVIEAAKRLSSERLPVKFVLCGSGDQLDEYRRAAKGCSSVIMPGRMNAAQVQVLMAASQIGIASIRNSINYVGHIPNKPIEYLSAGLPILTNLTGYLERTLQEYDCGRNYRDGDPDHLAELIRELYMDRAQVARFSENAKALFQDKFVAQKVYGQMAERIELLVASKSPQATSMGHKSQ